MPKTRVVLFKDEDGRVPVLDWLDELDPQDAVAKCIVLLELLKEHGHELRRPHADFLDDGIYELRARLNKLQLRMLYFFDKKVAVATHGFIKRGSKVPPNEIKRAKGCRESYKTNPETHTRAEA